MRTLTVILTGLIAIVALMLVAAAQTAAQQPCASRLTCSAPSEPPPAEQPAADQPASQQPASREIGGAQPTSNVAGETLAAVPNAGSGPGSIQHAPGLDPAIWALVGASGAWLLAGSAGLALLLRRGGGWRAGTARFVPVMRPIGRRR